MVTLQIRRFCVRAIAVSAACTAIPAFADISPIVFTIEATNSLGTATFTGSYEDGHWTAPDTYEWTAAGVSLTDGDGDVIATLESGLFRAIEDPIVNLLFDVQAGAADTTFSITSGLLSFSALTDPTGLASCGMTLTDSGQDTGAVFVGNGGPGLNRSYEANYNGTAPAGTNFAAFIPGLVVATPGGSNSTSDGTGGFLPIVGSVSSMSARFAFTLSANDSASGTSTFVIVPEPASLVLALAGVLAFRRRG